MKSRLARDEASAKELIRRAALEGLNREVLPHRARDEDERNVGTLVPRDGQRREAVETRQRVVGKNHVGLVRIELEQKSLARLDALGTEVDVRPAQLVIDQNHVGRNVFQNQDAHFIFHANTFGEPAWCLKSIIAARLRPGKWGEHRKPRAGRPQIEDFPATMNSFRLLIKDRVP